MFQDFSAYHHAPYPVWQEAAAGRGIHWQSDFLGGAWIVSDYALCEQVLRDSEHYSAARTGAWVGGVSDSDTLAPAAGHSAFQRLFARALLFVDAPDHARIRSLMQPYFKPVLLETLRESITHTVQTRCDAIEAQYPHEPFDWIEHLARPLPAQVIVQFLGLQEVSEAEHAQFMRWSRDLAIFIGVPSPSKAQWRTALRSLLQMAAFFESVFEQQRIAPGSLLAALQDAAHEGALHSRIELIAQSAMLLFAGHETTRHLLGTGVLRLLENRAQWQLLGAEPARAPAAVRELLRLEPPVQYTARRARLACSLGGQSIARNQLVIVSIAAAHRDPQRYAHADQLDITRSSSASLAFGSGPHVCIGAALTQMEAEITFAHISQRWPQLRVHAHTWDCSNLAYRGLQSLHVQL